MNENKKKNFEIRPVNDLSGFNFFVDDYQRGYKWTSQQVIDLLSDINNFNPDSESFYCLQPLVVKKRTDEEIKKNIFPNNSDNIYEVIDGQQRLTTIYIINKILDEEKVLFNIKYQTRKDSADFLENINKIRLSNLPVDDCNVENDISKFELKINEKWECYVKEHKDFDKIDNYHFFGAYLTIKNWFNNHDDKNAFSQKLKRMFQFYHKQLGYITYLNYFKILLWDNLTLVTTSDST